MKYGKYEYERTYLLKNNIFRNKEITNTKKIKDKYINDTRLRLRVVEQNDETTYKLTQKQKLNPPKRGILKINTIYLTKAEFDKLNVLEGCEIEKERQILQIGGIRIGVDRITINEKTLFIAEVEFETETEMNNFSMPLNYQQEVTGIQKYNGYELAKAYSKYKNINEKI